MGLDMNKVKLRSVLKKSKKMPMGGATTGKGECLSDAGTQTSHKNMSGSGIAVSKRQDQSNGTKVKYHKIVGNMGKLMASSGIAPRKRSTEGNSGVGAGGYHGSGMGNKY
jgi:hypothetical protein